MIPATVELKFEMVDASWVPVWFARSRYAEPSIPSKVPVHAPVRSRVRAPAVFRSPEPVRSVKVSELMPNAVVVALVEEALVAKSEVKMLCALQVFWVVVPNASEIALPERETGYENVSGASYVPKSET